MKKLLIILLILISFSSFAQFEAGEFINGDTAKIKGSSIIYPDADSVEQFYYSKMRDPSESLDGVNLRTLSKWLAGIDSTFYVREKPGCLNCWQYSYDNNYWVNWFCSETGASNLSIDYNADDILGIHYNSGLGAYTDSLYFRVIEADSGKVPMIVGDSVLWSPIPRDSLFDAYSSNWLTVGDTIPKQKDSIEINGEWILLGESVVTPNDTSLWKILDLTTIAPKTSGVNIGYETHVDEGLLVWTSGNSITAQSGTVGVTSSADSIGIESIGQKIGTYSRSTNGVGVKAYSHIGVAIDALSDDSTAINVVSGRIGINSYSQDGIAINASSVNESAIVGESFYSNGVKGLNTTGGIGVLGVSDYATGVKGTTQRGVGVYAEVTTQDGLPLVAQSTVYSPLVADFRGTQGIASNKLYLGGGTHEEKGAQLYIDGAQEIYGSSLENYGLLIRDSKGLYCDSILRLGGYLSGGVTYPSAPGRTGQFLRLRDSLSGILEFVDQDSSLWSISGTGIRSKIDNVGIGIDSDGHYGLSVQGIDYYPSLGLWQSGTGDFLQGLKGSSVIWNIDNDGLATFPSLTVGSGATITRSGTIASKDIWTGTAAEYAANTVKDGITPQASTTIAFILD